MSQILFDKIVLNLLAQGKPAMDEQGVYKYRCQSRRTILRSPVGFLIPDIVYSTEMEKREITELIRDTPELCVYFENIELLHALERVARGPSFLNKDCHYFVEDLLIEAKRFKRKETTMLNFEHVSSWITARMRAKSLLKEYNI